MLYLIDANVIITAKDSYYGVDQVPEFWSWLVHQGQQGIIKIPAENWDEVNPGSDKEDPFYGWRQDRAVREALVLNEDPDRGLVQHVFDTGYGTDLNDAELATIGRDPFLVAYALSGKDRMVVTTEVSRPSAQRHKRKVPDVCRDFGVDCWNTFQLTRTLKFTTGWNS